MTASVDARQVADLEELFGREIPCGGNRLTGYSTRYGSPRRENWYQYGGTRGRYRATRE